VRSPDPRSGLAIENIVKDGIPVPDERRFVIVKHVGKVPSTASCAKCQRKFFAPPTFVRDAVGAAEYLGYKFHVHGCPETIASLS
jgi:hypothetical protein